MAFAWKAGLIRGFPLRLVRWFGDSDIAGELIPILKDVGFEATEISTPSAPDCEGAWAVGLFLSNGNLDAGAALTASALDSATNVVAVARSPELHRELGERLAAPGIRYSDDVAEGGSEDQQITWDIPLVGGELRRVAYGKSSFLTGLEFPSQVPKPNEGLSISGDSVTADASQLLRRAFSDYDNLRVIAMSGGRLADAVLAVTGSKNGSPARPLPFVAKIASRQAIFQEARKFESRVRDFVPFANRPNFLTERSCVLASKGILVGQFADRAIPLDAAVRRGGGTAAIHELFSTVLHRWWANTFGAGSPASVNLTRAHPKTSFEVLA